MMILDFLILISIGVTIGLSGAIIPGPLLAFTILDTSQKGKITGHYVIMGHILWELAIIILIFLGFGWLIEGNSEFVYLIGGFALFLMGIGMVKRRNEEVAMNKSRIKSSLGGGLFYTAFNPTHPPWWATAGLALLVKGLEVMGILGVVLVTIGHWLSGFIYYLFVSFMVHRNKGYINPRQRQISILLSFFTIIFGLYFLAQGLLNLTF